MNEQLDRYKVIENALKSFADAVHQNALDKGFHDFGESDEQYVERACNLLHSEVSEFYEAHRNGVLHEPCDKAEKMKLMGLKPLTNAEEEMADKLIRILDSSRRMGIDVITAAIHKHLYNQTRSYRHGGKRS